MAPVLYAVRTPPGYRVVIAALCLLAAGCAGLVGWMLAQGHMSWVVLVFGGMMTALPFVYLATTGEYRADGAVRLGGGFIEVPGRRGEVLRFAAPGVAVGVTPVQVRFLMFGIPVGDVSRGAVVELREGARRRRLSTLTLVDRDLSRAMLADIDRVLRGEAPVGPTAAASPEPPPGPRDRLEDALERELAALDWPRAPQGSQRPVPSRSRG